MKAATIPSATTSEPFGRSITPSSRLASGATPFAPRPRNSLSPIWKPPNISTIASRRPSPVTRAPKPASRSSTPLPAVLRPGRLGLLFSSFAPCSVSNRSATPPFQSTSNGSSFSAFPVVGGALTPSLAASSRFPLAPPNRRLTSPRAPLPPAPEATRDSPRSPPRPESNSRDSRALPPLFSGTLLSGRPLFRSVSAIAHGFRHRISVASWSARSPCPRRHSHRASALLARSSSRRTLALPRTPLLLCLARRKGPLQADRHRHRLGRPPAASHHACFHSLFRTPRQAPLSRPSLSHLLFRRPRPLDLLRHVPPGGHQRRRRKSAPHHQGLLPASHPSYLLRHFRPR